MTSSTELLRRMLDERGVEWEDHSDEKHKRTDWDNGSCWFIEYEDGWTQWGMSKPVTPEQAIAATLGRGTCHITREPGSDRLWYCDHCGSYHEHPSNYAWEFCPRCGAKAVKE